MPSGAGNGFEFDHETCWNAIKNPPENEAGETVRANEDEIVAEVDEQFAEEPLAANESNFVSQ